MKRSYRILALLVMFGTLLAACAPAQTAAPVSGSGAAATSPAASGGAAAPTISSAGGSAPATSAPTALAKAPAGSTELSFYYPVAVPGPITKIVDGYMADFAQANPGLTAKAVLAGGYADALTKILTTLQGGGQPPDLAVLLSTDMQSLIDADAIVPLDSCISQIGGDAYLNDFFPAFMKNSQSGGHTWGIPFQRSTPVLYYNKQLFKDAGLDPNQPPKNWQELVDIGTKLLKKDASGNVTTWGVEIPSDGFPYWLFQSFAIENGQNVQGDDPTKVNFNAPSTVDALQFVVDLSKKYNIMPPGVIQWANVPNDFTGGKSAMVYHTTGSLTSILAQAKFDVGVAFMPAGKQYGAPTGGGNLYLFKKTPPDRQAAACKLIQFLTTPERAAQWSIDTGYVASRKSAYDTAAMKAQVQKYPQYLVARDQLQYADRELAGHQAAQLQQILGNGVQAAITGQKTPKQGLDDAQAQGEKLLAQFK